MNLKIELAVEEALAFHEAFRRLGYPPGDIFVAIHSEAQTGFVMPFVMLKSALLPEPVYLGCGVEHYSSDEQIEFQKVWSETVVAWNSTMAHAERMRIWQSSYVANHPLEFTQMLVTKGHRHPIPNGVFA